MATVAQSGKNFVIALKAEATYNTAPGASGATQLRLAASPGLQLNIAQIMSKEMRSDGLTPIGRHGSQDVSGSYNVEMAVGAHDVLLEAVMRATWVTATTLTSASGGALTSVACTVPNLVLAGGGSWITAGVRVGDVFRLTGVVAADANINLRVKSVSTLTITTHGSPITVASTATTTFTATLQKKLSNPATPTKRTFYVDEYNQDVDLSEVYGGCRIVGLSIKGSPNGMAEATFKFIGASAAALATGSSPYFTTPTLSTSLPLVFADATISYKGADITLATSFDLNYEIAAKTEPVIGSVVSPDVFDNEASLIGTFTAIRQDLAPLTDLAAETEFELHILLVEPMSEPKNYISIYVPRCKLANAADGGMGGDGAMLNTLAWVAGKKEGYATTGYDSTLLTITTSAP